MNNKNVRSQFVILAVALALLASLLPAEASAHKLSVYGYMEGELLHSESYFFDGSRCVDCTVRALDHTTMAELSSCKTDREGKCSFKIQSIHKREILLVLEAGAGHRAEYMVGAEEMEKMPAHASTTSTETLPSDLDRVLEAKLGPIRADIQRLREASERPGLTEILGGIGYIVGLFGILAYFKTRSQNPRDPQAPQGPGAGA